MYSYQRHHGLKPGVENEYSSNSWIIVTEIAESDNNVIEEGKLYYWCLNLHLNFQPHYRLIKYIEIYTAQSKIQWQMELHIE